MKMLALFHRSSRCIHSPRLITQVALGSLLLACATGISIGAAWSPEGSENRDEPSSSAMVRIRPAESAELDGAVPAVSQLAPVQGQVPKPMPSPLAAEPMPLPPVAGQACPAKAGAPQDSIKLPEAAGETLIVSDEPPVAEGNPVPRLTLAADEAGIIRQPSIASAEPPAPRASQPFALALIHMSPRSEALETKVEMAAAETASGPAAQANPTEPPASAAPAMVLQFPDPSVDNVKFRELPNSPLQVAEAGKQGEQADAADAAAAQEKVRPAGILAEVGETLASDTQLVQMVDDRPESRPAAASAWRNDQPPAVAEVSASDGWRASENSLPAKTSPKAEVALFKSPGTPVVAARTESPAVRAPAYQVARSNVAARVQPPIPADAGYAPALPPTPAPVPPPMAPAPMPAVQNGMATLASCEVSGCDECQGGAGTGGCWACAMPQHMPYMPTLHGYYYFRPYNAIHVVRHQEFVSRFGGDTRNPYSNAFFQKIYDDYRASRPATVKPAAGVPGR